MSDDWGDIDEDSRMGRRIAAARRETASSHGHSQTRPREQRFLMTLAAVAALMLVVGLAAGFAIGIAAGRRQSAPAAEGSVAVATATAEPTVTPAVETTVATETVAPVSEPTESVVPTTPSGPPDTPGQLAPDDGDRINADRVTLKWTKVSAPDGKPVTYAFEIQTRTDGKWGPSQVVSGIEKTSYSARVLTARRRWRVWAIASDGTKGDKSGWSEYAHTAAPKKTVTTTPSKPASSTTTTGTN